MNSGVILASAATNFSFTQPPTVTSDGLVIVGSSGSDASLLALKPESTKHNPRR